MRTSFIVTICFFIITHTVDFWGAYFSAFLFWATIFLLGGFLFVIGSFVNDIYYSIREKFQSKKRNAALVITSIVIILTIYKPFGIINYEMFTAKDLLTARRDSAANCATLFHLKKDRTFNETSFCFGLSRTTGVFRIINDTIWFKSHDNYYQFGIIGPSKHDSTHLYIHFFKNERDTFPNLLLIQESN